MPRIKYACCSHGPQHLRTRPHCGFAHVLHELDFPERIHSRLWCDRSHEHEGPAGIDIFVGQEYTAKQLDRLFAMLANEGLVGIPAWARQLAWFLGHGSSQYANDGDFGYFARMQIVSHTNFRTMKDSNGQTLNDRMQTRMATQTLFDVYVAKTGWSDNDKEYRDTTPLYWGAQSNQYLDIQAESAYYKIGCSDCDDPWWYMMPVIIQGSSLTYGGWAPPTYFTASEETLTLYEVEIPTLTLQEELYVNETAHAVLTADIPVHRYPYTVPIRCMSMVLVTNFKVSQVGGSLRASICQAVRLWQDTSQEVWRLSFWESAEVSQLQPPWPTTKSPSYSTSTVKVLWTKYSAEPNLGETAYITCLR